MYSGLVNQFNWLVNQSCIGSYQSWITTQEVATPQSEQDTKLKSVLIIFLVCLVRQQSRRMDWRGIFWMRVIPRWVKSSLDWIHTSSYSRFHSAINHYERNSGKYRTQITRSTSAVFSKWHDTLSSNFRYTLTRISLPWVSRNGFAISFLL